MALIAASTPFFSASPYHDSQVFLGTSCVFQTIHSLVHKELPEKIHLYPSINNPQSSIQQTIHSLVHNELPEKIHLCRQHQQSTVRNPTITILTPGIT
jgi:hypothetical protein